MKAIGIPQPNAWLVINDYLHEVVLSEPTDHRGEVLVYASSEPVNNEDLKKFVQDCRRLGIKSYPLSGDFDLGGFIGTASLTDCKTDHSGKITAIFDSPVELGFFSFEGGSNFFEFTDNPFDKEAVTIPRSKSVNKTANTTVAKKESPNPQSTSKPACKERVETDSSQDSYASHFFDGIEEGLKNKLKKDLKIIGRAVAKDAVNTAADFLCGIFKKRK
jgi:hypothetical protein